MNKVSIALAAAALASAVTWLASLYVFERPALDTSVEEKSLVSKALGETRGYLVHLPESYRVSPARKYPVVYVLDGSSQDLHTAASARLMARIGVMPEVIVVGVPNPSGAARQRDYTPPGMRQDLDTAESPPGRADAFLDFLGAELIPQVEKNYRTTPSRTLAGNSRGGLLVVYAATRRPALFDAYIANSPALWRDHQAMVARFDEHLRSAPPIAARLFLSLGEQENQKMKAAFERITRSLHAHAPPALRWTSQVTAGAAHGDNAERATPVALQWIFERASASGERPPPSARRCDQAGDMHGDQAVAPAKAAAP